MKRADHEIYIKIGAYLALIIGILFLIACCLGSVSIWIFFGYGALIKKILTSVGLIIVGGVGFFGLVALYEFLMEFLTMEQEVEELEKKMPE